MTLGLRAVSSLALAASIYDMTGQWELTINRHRFWRHSLQVALATRDIAEAIKYPYPEEAFVCGLLHDLGILVLEKSFPKKFQRVWSKVENGDPLHDLEEDIWGTNHARIGQFLLEQWGVPEIICQAVGMHHSGLLTQNRDPEFLPARMVALGNQLSRLTIAQIKLDLEADLETREALRAALDMDADKLTAIDKALLDKTMKEAQFLDIDLGSPEEILSEANRLIYENFLAVDSLMRENRRMQREIARAQVEKAALEATRTIAATLNHYINNAAATILGRAQLVEVKLKRGEIIDLSGETARSMSMIVNGVSVVCSVLEELKSLSSFSTTVYHDDTYIIDLEERLKNKLQNLQEEAQPDESETIDEQSPSGGHDG
jgi:HD-like signal output (HDOD) protein